MVLYRPTVQCPSLLPILCIQRNLVWKCRPPVEGGRARMTNNVDMRAPAIIVYVLSQAISNIDIVEGALTLSRSNNVKAPKNY
jgi:hypothetical protein